MKGGNGTARIGQEAGREKGISFQMLQRVQSVAQYLAAMIHYLFDELTLSQSFHPYKLLLYEMGERECAFPTTWRANADYFNTCTVCIGVIEGGQEKGWRGEEPATTLKEDRIEAIHVREIERGEPNAPLCQRKITLSLFRVLNLWLAF